MRRGGLQSGIASNPGRRVAISRKKKYLAVAGARRQRRAARETEPEDDGVAIICPRDAGSVPGGRGRRRGNFQALALPA